MGVANVNVASTILVLVHALAGVLGVVEVADTVLVEVFLLDEGEVRVALHLREGLLARNELCSRPLNDLALVNGSGRVAQLTEGLPLRELPEGRVLRLHVTVIGEVRVFVGASLL